MTASTAEPWDDEDRRLLAAYDPDEFERPSVTVDVVIVTISGRHLRVLVVERPEPPFRGWWALPGTFVRMDESLEEAAARALATKAGLTGIFLEQLYTFGAPERDPRTRVISVAYMALVDVSRFRSSLPGSPRLLEALVRRRGDDAVVLADERGDEAPLAFDHAEIVSTAVQRLRGKVDYTPVGYHLLPEEFTLRELQQVHETILDRELNKDSFRRRMLASDELEPTGRREEGVEHRPAELYRWRRRPGAER